MNILNKDYFRANSDGLAKDSNDFYIYETDTGKLFYDADGNGSGKSKQIALIENKASLTYADFVVLWLWQLLNIKGKNFREYPFNCVNSKI